VCNLLDYLVPSRADDLSCSPDAVILIGIRSLPGRLREAAVLDFMSGIMVGTGYHRCL
jgi:hypothetical protein